MNKLLNIMRKLRGEGGCPWDKEQTHKSLKRNLIEEAYETIDAIDNENDNELCEELGDVLLQVAFHTVIAEEEKRFTYDDIETGVCDKMVSRHTHIFGDDIADSAEDVLKTWKNNKKKEKDDITVTQSMKNVPASFPALLRSYKVQDKAADVGFDWDRAYDAMDKLEEEINELKQAVESHKILNMEEEAGDLLFSVVNVCRLLKIDPETALNQTIKKFIERFEFMENMCLQEDRNIHNMTLCQWDELWGMAKSEEKRG